MRSRYRSAGWTRQTIRSARHWFPAHQCCRLARHLAAFGPLTVIIGLAFGTSGCAPAPASPLAPSPGVTAAAPAVTAVVPAVGSAAGGSIVTIVGTGFAPGMTVTFGDGAVTARVQHPTSTSTRFYTEAPPHAVGTVDLIVTNPDRQFQRVAAAYTYRREDAFDMNGVWAGFTVNGTDTAVEFEIRDNTLVRAVCAFTSAVPFVFSTPPRVENGGFSLIAADGATLVGKIVSDSEIVGDINFPPCNSGHLTWRVSRQ